MSYLLIFLLEIKTLYLISWDVSKTSVFFFLHFIIIYNLLGYNKYSILLLLHLFFCLALYFLPISYYTFCSICFCNFWNFFLLCFFLFFNYLANFYPFNYIVALILLFSPLHHLCFLFLLFLKILTITSATFYLPLSLLAFFSRSGLTS